MRRHADEVTWSRDVRRTEAGVTSGDLWFRRLGVDAGMVHQMMRRDGQLGNQCSSSERRYFFSRKIQFLT